MQLLSGALDALAEAHDQQVAHRDIKPDNLFVTTVGERTIVKLLDFGIAKRLSSGDTTVASSRDGGAQQSLLAFTPRYAAPEQFHPGLYGTGPWTDTYALALVLIEMIAGPKGIAARTADLFARALDPDQRPTPRVQGVVVSGAVEAVFAKALALDPKERFHSVCRMRDALEKAASGADELALSATLLSEPPPEFEVAVQIEVAAPVAERPDGGQPLPKTIAMTPPEVERAQRVARASKKSKSARSRNRRPPRPKKKARAKRRRNELAEQAPVPSSRAPLSPPSGPAQARKFGLARMVATMFAGVAAAQGIDFDFEPPGSSIMRYADPSISCVEDPGGCNGAATSAVPSSDSSVASTAARGPIPIARNLRAKPAASLPLTKPAKPALKALPRGKPKARPIVVPKLVRCTRLEPACYASGRCTPRGNRCVADSAADCKRSTGCLFAGRCLLESGACIATSASCRDNLSCRISGLCSVSRGTCKALSDADCNSSSACRIQKRCRAVDGACKKR